MGDKQSHFLSDVSERNQFYTRLPFITQDDPRVKCLVAGEDTEYHFLVSLFSTSHIKRNSRYKKVVVWTTLCVSYELTDWTDVVVMCLPKSAAPPSLLIRTTLDHMLAVHTPEILWLQLISLT